MSKNRTKQVIADQIQQAEIQLQVAEIELTAATAAKQKWEAVLAALNQTLAAIPARQREADWLATAEPMEQERHDALLALTRVQPVPHPESVLAEVKRQRANRLSYLLVRYGVEPRTN